jgi:2-iminobutanoate/2-iminopropanoate deaminase
MRSAFIMICMVSAACSHKAVYTSKAPAPLATYSQGLLANNTLYVSGQIALRSDGTMDTTSIKNECRQVMENIRIIVAAAKMTMANVTKCTIYLTDLKYYSDVNEVYGEYVSKKNPPARETVQVQALPKGAHIEISAIAVK